MAEWRLQRKDVPLTSVAIVDEAPQQQYLYPGFLLYRQIFKRHGIEAVICGPASSPGKMRGCGMEASPLISSTTG